MYPGYIEDRKALGYAVLNDSSCEIKFVLISDSTVRPIKNLPSNVKNVNVKIKRIIGVVAIIVVITFSNVRPAEAIGLSMPPSQIVRVHKPSYDYRSEMKIAPTVSPRLDKILMLSTNKMIPLIYINGRYSYINDQLLKKLRSGDLSANLTVIAVDVVIYVMCQLSGVDAFAILRELGKFNAPTVDPGFGLNPTYGWLSGKHDSRNIGPSWPPTELQMEKPSLMPQQQYSGLTKSERRQLADPKGRDGSISVDGYPRLDLRYNQVEFKTPNHGKDHGLPTDDNGKTPKTEANAIRDSLINMPNKPNVIWYKEGMYQGGTPRGSNCINLFDPDTNLIAVYQKQADGSNLFLTTCELTEIERDHLNATDGNFVTERVLNEQKAVSTNIRDNTNNNNGLQ